MNLTLRIVNDPEGSKTYFRMFDTLIQAARDGKPEDVAKVLNNQTDPRLQLELINSFNKDVDGVSPLIAAAASGNLENVKYLLSQGALVDLHSYRGNTPLIAAATEVQYDVVKWLLHKTSANVNLQTYRSETPLMEAIVYHYDNTRHHECAAEVGIVQLLLNNGADIAMRNQFSQQAIDIARERRKDVKQYYKKTKPISSYQSIVKAADQIIELINFHTNIRNLFESLEAPTSIYMRVRF